MSNTILKRDDSRREAKAQEIQKRIEAILGLLDAHKRQILTLEREVINNLRHEYQQLTGTGLNVAA